MVEDFLYKPLPEQDAEASFFISVKCGIVERLLNEDVAWNYPYY